MHTGTPGQRVARIAVERFVDEETGNFV